jgi:hypothetical protein
MFEKESIKLRPMPAGYSDGEAALKGFQVGIIR